MLSAPVATPGEEKKLSVLLSALVERFGVSRMRIFLKLSLLLNLVYINKQLKVNNDAEDRTYCRCLDSEQWSRVPELL